MGLNISKGNMYEWVTHTWNAIKGECPHGCTYCYVKRWGKQPDLHFDEKELKTDLGQGNTIFVGSSCDMFAEGILYEWIIRTIDHLNKFNNTYLFQSKNPKWFDVLAIRDVKKFILCTTIETNRVYPDIMKHAPDPIVRAFDFGKIPIKEKYITIEPIMDFDHDSLVELIKYCRPLQVNIGADSGRNGLPEPSRRKILELMEDLDQYTVVKEKKNLKRLLT